MDMNSVMNCSEILSAVDAEIARLQSAGALLAGRRVQSARWWDSRRARVRFIWRGCTENSDGTLLGSTSGHAAIGKKKTNGWSR
jgi:hypothetical protein